MGNICGFRLGWWTAVCWYWAFDCRKIWWWWWREASNWHRKTSRPWCDWLFGLQDVAGGGEVGGVRIWKLKMVRKPFRVRHFWKVLGAPNPGNFKLNLQDLLNILENQHFHRETVYPCCKDPPRPLTPMRSKEGDRKFANRLGGMVLPKQQPLGVSVRPKESLPKFSLHQNGSAIS